MQDNMCFACSPKNPVGLHLTFTFTGDVCRTVFKAGENHQGWDGFLHGGLIATLLDEVMAQWLWTRKITAMTAELNVRYSLPVKIGEEITVEARCEKMHRRFYQLAAEAILPDGRRAARATAKYLAV
ncbi:MAG: PaaI family thioesterase [Desulfotomaculales bacterium]